MLSFIELGAAFCCILCVFAIYLLARSEVDLTLMFMERYGKPPESLAGQVVWITGATGGIGEYLACHLANAGCRLVLSARKEEELARVKAACLKAGEGRLSPNDILVLVFDFTQFDSHRDAVQRVLEYFGRIDILVNNAGRAQRAAWMDVSLDEDRQMFEINVLGPVSLTQQVLPHMIEKKRGHIVVISSIAGKIGLPLARSYGGSKFAIQGVFECLRAEVEEYNIDVSLICPGPYMFVHGTTTNQGQLVKQLVSHSGNRVTYDRCASAITVAMANKLYEVWITQCPWLILIYFCQYFPDAGKWLFLTVGAEQLTNMRGG